MEVYFGKFGRDISFRGLMIPKAKKKVAFPKVLPKVMVVNLSLLGRDAKKALRTTERKKV
jgi:hypothetical protein